MPPKDRIPYYLFLDESGDHGLSNINPYFPVFLLCGVLFERNDYEQCRLKINQLKRKFWNSEEVILHSSDIRKCNKEFQILFDIALKGDFYNDLNKIITESKYTIIADCIEKSEYILKYGKLSNVYELCLSFIIERAVFFLDDIPVNKSLCIVIEQRGKQEDKKLTEHFNKLLSRGTGYVKPERLTALGLRIEFRSKKKNINGLQLSDILAYPIARHVIDKNRPNPAYDVLLPKIYTKDGKMYGLKIFP